MNYGYANEILDLNPESAEIRLLENDAFIKYMTIIVDLAEKDLTLFDLSPKQYDVLKSLIDQKAQISVMAENDLFAFNNSLFEHPVYKHGGEKSMKVSNSSETNLGTIFEIYPNPSADLVNIRFELESNYEDRIINIYDALGKIRKSVSISDSKQRLTTINCSNLTNGFYTCTLVCDKKIVGTKKFVIIK